MYVASRDSGRDWKGRSRSLERAPNRTRVQYPPRRIRSPIGLSFLGLVPPPPVPPPPPTPAGASVLPLTPGGGGGFAFASVVEMVAGERDACVGSSRVGAGRLDEVLPPPSWCWCWFPKPEGGEGGCAGAGRVCRRTDEDESDHHSIQTQTASEEPNEAPSGRGFDGQRQSNSPCELPNLQSRTS